MKRFIIFFLLFLISLCCLTDHLRSVKHADPFYDYDDFDMVRIPLINPIEANYLNASDPWDISLKPCVYVDFPNRQGSHYYTYCHVRKLEKFAVQNGVIMAYSSYINEKADVYIQENYYHWFVLIPEKEITEGFHTETEFLEYLKTLGIEDIDWQLPDEAQKQFRKTGCLEWFPDCE